LKKHNVTGTEAELFKDAVKEQLAVGVPADQANVFAIESIREDLEKERQDIINLTKSPKSGMKNQRVDLLQAMEDSSPGAKESFIQYMAEISEASKTKKGTKTTLEREVEIVSRNVTNEQIQAVYKKYKDGTLRKDIALPDEVKKIFDQADNVLGLSKRRQADETGKLVGAQSSASMGERGEMVRDLLADAGVLERGSDGTIPARAFQVVPPKNTVEKGVAKLGAYLGLDVIFYTSTALRPNLINGITHPNMPRTVFIRRESSNPVVQVVGHEFVHVLRRSHPDQFKALVSILVESGRFIAEGNDSFSLAAKYDQWKANLDRAAGETYNNEAAAEEYLGDFIGELLLQSNFAGMLLSSANKMAEDRSVVAQTDAESFLAVVNGFLRTLNSVVEKILKFFTSRKNRADDVTVKELEKIATEINKVLHFENVTQPVDKTAVLPPGQRTGAENLQYQMVWYSEMERVLSSKLPGKGSGKSMAATVQAWADKGMFKREELEWSGLIEWLQGQKSVTRQEVVDWLAQNNVRVQEVVKGGMYVDTDKSGYYAVFDDSGKKVKGNFDTAGAAEDWLGSQPDTKFSGYQMEGEKSGYKELLITLPGGEFVNENHYSEKGVLAHVRFNERTGPNGERVLFIEEVQSDWHQIGRKEGYKTKADVEFQKLSEERDKIGKSEAYRKGEDGAIERYAELSGRLFDLAEKAERKSDIPDAPFKKTWPMLAMKRMVRYAADNGFDVVAWTPGSVQNDRYEDELRQNVDNIWWQPSTAKKEATKEFSAEKNGKTVAYGAIKPDGEIVGANIGRLNGKTIEEVFGKTIGGRMLSEEEGDLTGDGLSVGGQGMIDFYDKILPAEVNAFFGKAKWGKAKVGSMELITEHANVEDFSAAKLGAINIPEKSVVVHAMPITPEMRGQSMPQYQEAGASPVAAPLGLSDFRKAFPGREVGHGIEPGSFWVKIRDGVFLTIKNVENIDDATIRIEYGMGKTQKGDSAGVYASQKILLSKTFADMATLRHETMHFLEHINLITAPDIKAIHRAMEKAGWTQLDGEGRAEFVARALRDREAYRNTPLGAILQKIADFLDGIVNLATRTGRGVLRDIESGRVYDRDAAPAASQTGVAYQSRDTQYLSAVAEAERTGDWSEVQKMVDEAARGAGYEVEGWHGSHISDITEFKPNENGAIFFSTDRGTAKSFAHRKDSLYHARLSAKNPFIVDAEGKSFAQIIPSWYIVPAKRAGHDSVLVKNIKDDIAYKRTGDTYIVFDPSQIKSADPVTRYTKDDPQVISGEKKEGEIISLDDRFNDQSDDIRYQSVADQMRDFRDTATVVRKAAPGQWAALLSGLRSRSDLPASTIAAPDLKRGVLGFLNSLMPTFAHAKKFPQVREALDSAQRGQSLQHLMNLTSGENLRDFYKMDKAQKKQVTDLLIAEDSGGFVHDYDDLINKGADVEIVAAARAIREELDERLKAQTRGTLPAKLASMEREREEAADIIHAARTRDELKAKLIPWAEANGIELNESEIDHISFIFDHVQESKGYVPHKWKHPWRVMFTSKNEKGEQVTTIRDFPLAAGVVLPREEMRTNAALTLAEGLMQDEFGWTDKQIKDAKANADHILALIERKKELLVIGDRKQAMEVQKEINGIMDEQPTFRVIHSREMPTDFFEGARPEQMQAIMTTAITNALDKLSQKDRDVTGMAAEIDAQVKMELEMLYLKKGGMKSLLKRKNIQGFREDLDNVIAEYLAETASAIVKRDMARDFSKILSGIDAARQPALWQEIKDYAKDVLSPTPEATMFKMVAGVMYLGADISAVILNTTQNYTHGVGALWAIKGKGNPVSQILKAQKDIANVWIDMKKRQRAGVEGADNLFDPNGIPGVITAEEVAMLRRLKDEGKLDPQLLGEQTGFKVNQISENRVVMAAMFKLFGAAEGMNRLSLALAAMRRAKSAGTSEDAALDIAAKAVEKAHFLYGRSNRPKIVRSLDRATGKLAVGSTAYTFMTYPMMNLVYIRDYMWDMFEGIYKGDKDQTRAAMKMAGAQFGFTMLFGGMTALPFYGLAQAVATLFGDDDDEDWETMVRRHVDGVLGEGITRGTPAMMGLFDMSMSVEGTNIFQTPVGIQVLQNMKKRLGQSWDMALHDEYSAAAFHMTPDFMRNPYRAFWGMRAGGEHRYAPPIKYTGKEAATRALGLTPPRESEAYRKAQQTLEMQTKRSEKIRNMARRVMVDRSEIRKVRKEISEYNKQAMKKRLPRIVWNDIMDSINRQKKSRTEDMTDRPAKYMDKYTKGLQ
jgi:hypothetical protein